MTGDWEPSAGLDRRRLAWRLARLLAVAAVAVLLIRNVPGLGSLRSRFAHADAGWVLAVVALEVGSVLSFVVAFHSAFAARIRWRGSVSLALTAQGINVLVPAGGTGGLAAVGVIMNRAGLPAAFTVGRMVALFLVCAVAPNVLMIIVAGIGVGIGVLPGHATFAESLLPALIACALIGIGWYLSTRLPAGVPPGRSGWRAAAGRALAYLREAFQSTGELLRAADPLLILGALGFVLLDLGALAAAFHAVGAAGLPLGTMALAYTLGQAGSIIPLPGTTEGGLIGVFVLYGVPLVPATSAILLYRAVQILVPLALGLVGMVELRHLFGERAPLNLTPADGAPQSPAPSAPRG